MAKKEQNQEVEFSTETMADEPMFESEAYGVPQPEAGADVTVTKPVGIGAPVPIVAPRHTTIQLQPIVVPLAVIPYMSQDSDVLRTDYQQQRYVATNDYESQPAEFTATAEEKKRVKKKTKVQPRVFALFTCLLAAISVLPFILSYWFKAIFSQPIGAFDIITVMSNWVETGFKASPYTNLVYIAVFGLAGILFISSLISIIVGRYARVLNSLLAIGAACGMIAVLIKDLVKNQFVLENKIIFIVLLAVTVVNAILTIAFSIALNRLDDKVERIDREI